MGVTVNHCLAGFDPLMRSQQFKWVPGEVGESRLTVNQFLRVSRFDSYGAHQVLNGHSSLKWARTRIRGNLFRVFNLPMGLWWNWLSYLTFNQTFRVRVPVGLPSFLQEENTTYWWMSGRIVVRYKSEVIVPRIYGLMVNVNWYSYRSQKPDLCEFESH